jgi:hypothetical protein
MTDDMTKRLRAWARDMQTGRDCFGADQDLNEAADEIERLRDGKNNMIEATKKFVESAQKANDTIDNLWVETQDKHLARIAELEEALREIADGPRDAEKSYVSLLHELQSEARAALAKDTQTS